jgi:hypothetical protein
MVVKQNESRIDRSPFLPLLIVGVRGTASTLDGMVNLNGEPRMADSLLVSGRN